MRALCWNPSPKRGSPGANGDHTAGNGWRSVALQESVGFSQHEVITRQLHVAHVRGAPLFSMGTLLNQMFKSNQSTNLRTRHTARAVALNVFLAVRTAIIHEDIDLVAEDFNGASWRRKTGSEQPCDSAVEEAFKNAGSLCLAAPHCCGTLSWLRYSLRQTYV